MTGAIDPSFIDPIYSGASLADDITSTNTNLFGSGNDPTISVPAAAQSIVDGVNNAVNGGIASGAPLSSLMPNLGAIPQRNIMITADAAAAVTVDAIGPGSTNTTPATGTLSTGYNHAVGASANDLTIWVLMQCSNLSKASLAVTIGGEPASLIYTQPFDTTCYFAVYRVANPNTGSQALSAVATGTGVTFYELAMGSVSVVGRGAVRVTLPGSGTSANPSMPLSGSAVNDLVVQGFAVINSAGSAAQSSYSQTAQYNSGNLNPSGGKQSSLLIGTAAGSASTITFSDTAGSDSWKGFALSYEPTGAVVGSGFLQRRGSTGTVSGSSGGNGFDADFFDNTVFQTSDITLATGGAAAQATVSVAGWYDISASVALASTSTNYYLFLFCDVNGGPGGCGQTLFVNASTPNYIATLHVSLYLNAGDQVGLDYWLSTNVTNLFTGETALGKTRWSMALTNRSLM